MGQRHQCYYNLHGTEDVTVNERGKKAKTHMISFHDQWAYGTMPLSMLKYVLMYNGKVGKEYNFSNPKSYLYGNIGVEHANQVIQHLITVNAQDGFHTSVTNTTDETVLSSGRHDPLRGDNNDGITVVDFTVTGKPAYAFVNISESDKQYPKFLDPMSAEEYVSSYYLKKDPRWKKWNIAGLVKKIDGMARLLTTEELAVLFPTMYTGWIEERRLLENPEQRPVLIASAKFESNRREAERLLAA